jgi:hypothetical protein
MQGMHVKKGRTAEENSLYPDTNTTRGLLLVSPLVTMHAAASEGTPPRRIGLKMQGNSLPAVPQRGLRREALV